jgi:hypothetical protein
MAWAQDKNLHLPGRAELPAQRVVPHSVVLILCPEFLGGAAAPPCRDGEEFCRAPNQRKTWNWNYLDQPLWANYVAPVGRVVSYSPS